MTAGTDDEKTHPTDLREAAIPKLVTAEQRDVSLKAICRTPAEGDGNACALGLAPDKPGMVKFDLSLPADVQPHYFNFNPRLHQINITLPDGQSLLDFLVSPANAASGSARLFLNLIRTENAKSVLFVEWQENGSTRPIGALSLYSRWWWGPDEFLRDFSGEPIELPATEREIAMLNRSLILTRDPTSLREPGGAAAVEETLPQTDTELPHGPLGDPVGDATAHSITAAEDLSALGA